MGIPRLLYKAPFKYNNRDVAQCQGLGYLLTKTAAALMISLT